MAVRDYQAIARLDELCCFERYLTRNGMGPTQKGSPATIAAIHVVQDAFLKDKGRMALATTGPPSGGLHLI